MLPREHQGSSVPSPLWEDPDHNIPHWAMGSTRSIHRAQGFLGLFHLPRHFGAIFWMCLS